MRVFFRWCIVVFIGMGIVSCADQEASQYLTEMENLLWTNPDSCLSEIEQCTITLSPGEKQREELIRQHALLKTNETLESDTIVEQLAEMFLRKKDYRDAAEAYYILGAYYRSVGLSALGTENMKRAETLYRKAGDIPAILYGMLYFHLGNAAEEERIYMVAREYHMKALPFLKEAAQPRYLATIYDHLSSCQQEEDVELAICYNDTALHYAAMLDNDRYYKELEVVRYAYLLQKDTSLVIDNMHYLCDSCGVHSYGAELASYYIESGEYEKAQHYLQQLAQDTLLEVWCREQYLSLSAEWLVQQGKPKEAYLQLKDLHERQTKAIEETAYAKTYIITQRYDAAREREKLLEETLKKQQAYGVTICSVLLTMLLAGLFFYSYKKKNYALRLSEEKNKRMQEEMEKKRVLLQLRLRERLNSALHIHQWASQNDLDIPDGLNNMSPRNAFADQENWRGFQEEYNACYDNKLSKIKARYPLLTDSDLQYIVLSSWNFNTSEICFLLKLTKRTIWNRRAAIKQHLGLTENDSLQEWILAINHLQ